MRGFPQAVSPPVASSEFPTFQPTLIWLATWAAGGRVCARAAAGRSASRKNGLTHFSDEGDGSALMRKPPSVLEIRPTTPVL
jgi:hypothetical protein